MSSPGVGPIGPENPKLKADDQPRPDQNNDTTVKKDKSGESKLTAQTIGPTGPEQP
jgi:hypothetical protein